MFFKYIYILKLLYLQFWIKKVDYKDPTSWHLFFWLFCYSYHFFVLSNYIY